MIMPPVIEVVADFDSTSESTFAEDVRCGLSKQNKFLSSKYFYDDEGSRLFEQITKLDEYYLTRSEKEVIENNKADISSLLKDKFDGEINIVELGAGDGHKTLVLMNQFIRDNLNVHYVPIDISMGALESLKNVFEKAIPDIHFQGLVSDYRHGINWINREKASQNFVMFLGSNIGNFHTQDAFTFLKNLKDALNPNDLMFIGFDLKKEISVLTKAYNDDSGVTAQFNMNLLTRLNRELGANFDLAKFRFHSFYNPTLGAIESFLISLEKQDVYIDALSQSFHFKDYEAIHTEFSFKYTPDETDEFAKGCGFKPLKKFTDEKKNFLNCIWQVEG